MVAAPIKHDAVRECVGHDAPTHKMPGHWLLAKMGKRVLRPGGLELTRRLLVDLDIHSDDDVVEFVNNLRRTDYFTDINLQESRAAVESQISLYQFKLAFRLKG